MTIHSTARILLAFVGLVLTSELASSQTAVGQATTDHIIIYTQQPAAQTAGATAALVQRAQEQGQVRVIIGLRMTMTPAHALPAAQAQQQLATLQASQNAVASRVLGRTSGDDIVRFTFIPYMSMYVDAAQVSRLLADPEVVVVKEDVPRPPLDTDSIPLIHADKLWLRHDTGKGRTVAILDTGVAKNHPVLKGKVISEACFSSNNGTTGRSLCPGGVVASVLRNSGINCPVGIAGCDHGTHVASIAAATETADQIGVAPNTKIIAIKVFTKLSSNTACDNHPPCIKSYDSDWIQGLQRVYDLREIYNIDAVNMSLGSGKFDSACNAANPDATDAIATLRGAQIATIISSGNDGYDGFVGYPACNTWATAVGASSKVPEGEANFSNDSPLVKLLAPGVDITAAVPGNLLGVKSGTSMAAPHVTGSIALLSQASPAANVDQILASLVCTAKMIPVLGVGRPRIDLFAAYNRIVAPGNNQRGWSFTSPAEENDWTPLIGTWQITGGAHVQTTTKTGWIGSSTHDCNSTEQIVATVKRTAPREKDVFSNSGIAFKATLDYSDNKYVTGYWVAFNKCPTNVSGECTGKAEDPPGQAVFYRIDHAPWATGSQFGTLLCQQQAKQVKVNGFNTIKVFSENGTHSFYINNKLVCTVSDTFYPTGSVMTAAYLATAEGHEYSVSSVDITSFDDPVAPHLTEVASNKDAPRAKPPNRHVRMIDPASHAPRPLPPGMSPAGSRPVGE